MDPTTNQQDSCSGGEKGHGCPMMTHKMSEGATMTEGSMKVTQMTKEQVQEMMQQATTKMPTLSTTDKTTSTTSMESLFDRCGREKGITELVALVVDMHIANPIVAPRFMKWSAGKEKEDLKKRATEYFVCAAQHPTSFMQSCKDLGPVHRGMNINEREFVAVIDDTMKAMKQLKVGQREQEEMLYIMWMLKGSVVNL